MWPFKKTTETIEEPVMAETENVPAQVWDIHEVSKSEEGRGDFKLYYPHPVGEADFLDTRRGFESESDARRYLDEAGYVLGAVYR